MIHINGKYGYIEFYDKDGGRHRDNGPAVINKNYQVWYKNGKLNRDDGPTVINKYYQEGILME